MQSEMWDVEQVIPYARNPRKNDEAVAAVAESIKRFGFRQPLVVTPDGTLVVGHTRLAAALALGLRKVPVTVARGLSETQVRAYRILDNKSREWATWDDDLLAREIAAIEEAELLVGFDEEEIQRSLARYERAGEAEERRLAGALEDGNDTAVEVPLSWPGGSVVITAAGVAHLRALLRRHAERSGSFYGFVRAHLVET